MMFSVHRSVIFPVFLLELISSFIPLHLEKILDMMSTFLVYLNLLCAPTYDLSLRKFCVHLGRMCIFLHLDGMFYTNVSNPSGLIFHLRVFFSLLTFCLNDLTTDVSEVGFKVLLFFCQFLPLDLIMTILYKLMHLYSVYIY